jgi:hypothetical protein
VGIGGNHNRLKRINSVIRAAIGGGSLLRVYLGIGETNGSTCAVKLIRLRELSRTTNGLVQSKREIRSNCRF